MPKSKTPKLKTPMSKRTFSGAVIQRFMSEGQLEDFFDNYSTNRFHRSRDRITTDKDRLILTDWRKGMHTGELMKKHKMTNSALKTAIAYASRELKTK